LLDSALSNPLLPLRRAQIFRLGLLVLLLQISHVPLAADIADGDRRGILANHHARAAISNELVRIRIKLYVPKVGQIMKTLSFDLLLVLFLSCSQLFLVLVLVGGD